MEHHVYFWLSADRQNAADRKTFEKGLDTLFQIKSVKSGLWAEPAATAVRPVTDNTWTYAISVSFESLADHDAYQVDPEHDIFVDAFKSWWEKVEVKDLA